jgi:hypothetical protein
MDGWGVRPANTPDGSRRHPRSGIEMARRRHGWGPASGLRRPRLVRRFRRLALLALPVALLTAGGVPACGGAGGDARGQPGGSEGSGSTAAALVLGARVAPGAGAVATAEDPLAFQRGADALAGLGFRGFFAHHFRPLDGEETLAELFDHPTYRGVLEHPHLDLLVFTVRSLGEPIDLAAFDGDPATREPRLAEEESQVLDLARRLLADPALAGKTVVLKFWESDWLLVRPSRADEHATVAAAAGFVEWMRVRQGAVERARAERPDSPVRLLHAVEVNRVHDALPADGSPGLLRAVHLLPRIAPDFVAYSAWDSTNPPADPAALRQRLGAAIDLLLDPARQVELAAAICRQGGPCLPAAPPPAARWSPDRLFLSEFGAPETEVGAATAAWKAETVVRLAAERGLLAAFAWQLFDAGGGRFFLLDADGEPSGTLLGMLRARDLEPPLPLPPPRPDLRSPADGG